MLGQVLLYNIENVFKSDMCLCRGWVDWLHAAQLCGNNGYQLYTNKQ